MTPASGAAIGAEGAMILAGLWLVWRFALSRKGRDSRYLRLSEWRLPPIDFGCFIAFAFLGAAVAGSVGAFALRPLRLGDDAAMVAGGAVMHGGILLGLGVFFLVYGAKARGGGAARGPYPVLLSGLVTFLIALPAVFAASSVWDYVLQRLGLPGEKQDMLDILQNSHSWALKGSLVAVATILVLSLIHI